MADGKRLFTAGSFYFLPGEQSIPADVLVEIVAIFPEEARGRAGVEVLDAVNMYLSHQRAAVEARAVPDLVAAANALGAAADAIQALSRWPGWAGLAEQVAADHADAARLRGVQARAVESKRVLWELAAMVRAVEKPGGRPDVDPARVLALRLRSIYWTATGTRRLGAVGGASVRGRRPVNPQGQFILAVFERVGIGGCTGEGLNDLLRAKERRRAKVGKPPSKTR
jgi:hypothetical protein